MFIQGATDPSNTGCSKLINEKGREVENSGKGQFPIRQKQSLTWVAASIINESQKSITHQLV